MCEICTTSAQGPVAPEPRLGGRSTCARCSEVLTTILEMGSTSTHKGREWALASDGDRAWEADRKVRVLEAADDEGLIVRDELGGWLLPADVPATDDQWAALDEWTDYYTQAFEELIAHGEQVFVRQMGCRELWSERAPLCIHGHARMRACIRIQRAGKL